MISLHNAFVLVPEPFELLHDLVVPADPLVDDEEDGVEGKDGTENET
jgi:hypothetical protein